MNRPSWLLRSGILLSVMLGCGDGACTLPPCPLPLAIELTVSAANAPKGIAGLTLAIDGAARGTGFCEIAPMAHCYVPGGPGVYQLELTAPGYTPVELGVTVAGTEGPCTCPTTEPQRLSVVMQPTGT
jgi:hypothetical protein